ncbi:MAG: S8 family serine peptidase [Thermodesulfobacteriota bacterium]
MKVLKLYFYRYCFIVFVINLSLAIILSSNHAESIDESNEIPLGQPGIDFVPGSILVRFKPGTSENLKTQGRGKINALIKRKFKIVEGLEQLNFSGLTMEEAIDLLKKLPFVEYAEPDFVITLNNTIPNDSAFSNLWGLNQSSDVDIDAPEAWDFFTGEGEPNFVVAIIDTGIDINHPDLASNIWTNPGEIPNNSLDDDGNGFVDDVHGWDFVDDDNNPFDGYGHGTHVAGTVCSIGNNGIGIVGVLWQCKLMPLKFISDSGFGTASDAVRAIEYATKMGIKVSNNSWGDDSFSQSIYDAINNSKSVGHIFVAAAGNENINTDFAPRHYPSSFDLDNIISVAAIDINGNRASFSNWGVSSVDLGAPGVNVYSTLPNNSYGNGSGTSMATPHVAGVVALVYALRPNWSYTDVRKQIFDNIFPLGSLSDITATGGIVNAFKAIQGLIAPPQDNTVFQDSFENGLISWSQDSQNDWFRSSQRSVDGSSSAEIDGFASNAQLISPRLNLQGITNATISFSWLIESGLDTGEFIAFQVSTNNGASWVEMARLRGNVDPENVWQAVSIGLNNIDNLRMRFTGSMSLSDEDANVDKIVVTKGPIQNPIDNPPNVLITNPLDNDLVSGTLTISADADDDFGIGRVDFFVNNDLIGTDDTPPYEIPWDSTTVVDGDYTITATAIDTANLNSSDSINVTVDNVVNQPPQEIIVFQDSFENGLTNWSLDSQNDWFRSSQRSVDGSFSAEIDGFASNAQLISSPINLQGKTNTRISFSWLIERGLDTGEFTAFQVSTNNGASWVEMARLRGNVDSENVWHNVSIELNNINNLRMRFTGSMSLSSEDADVDMIVVNSW